MSTKDSAQDRHADLDALDRLVDAELSSLIAGLKRRGRPERPTPRAAPAEAIRPRPPAEARRAAIDSLLAADETAFLDTATDWLKDRPNADILLDVLGRRVLDPAGAAPAATETGRPDRPLAARDAPDGGDDATESDADPEDRPAAGPPDKRPAQ